jgi:hypothetical protein
MPKIKLLPVPTSRADVGLLLHEAVVIGHWDLGLVVSRRRPHIPCGEDPAAVNAECARCYAVWTVDDEWHVGEISSADVIPFVDAAARIAEAGERANAAQRTNVKPEGDA